MSASRVRPAWARSCTIVLDGEPLPAREGEPVAAALLGAGVEVIGRSPKYHRPRGAPCGQGHCHHCLVQIDAQPNRRACLTPCREGMQVERQNSLGSAEHDLLAATDWLFPRGLDHHVMFTGMPLLQPMVQKVVRKLSGLGTLPPGATPPPVTDAEATQEAKTLALPGVDVLVLGAGSAGLAAAAAAIEAGASTLLVEARQQPGGRGLSPLHRFNPAAPPPGLRICCNTTAEWISRPGRSLEVVIRRDRRLHRITPTTVVIATGALVTLAHLQNNDLPGLFDARWAAELIRHHGVLPGREVALCALPSVAERLRHLFEEAGARIVASLPAEAALGEGPTAIRAVQGKRWVETLEIETPEGPRTLACDAVVHALPRHPAIELTAVAGVKVGWDESNAFFHAVAGPQGETCRPGVFVAGSLCGRMTLEASADAGRLAGAAAAGFADEARGEDSDARA